MLTTFSNLEYLNFCPSSIWNYRLFFWNPYPHINSSTLLGLHISLIRFTDCLYILDGRFIKLQSLHVDINSISIPLSKLININQEKLPNLRSFSLYCGMATTAYDKLILPLLQRMSNLENLRLNILVYDKNQFVDGNDLKENILNHMLQLERFEFYICSDFYFYNQIDFPSKEDIQYTFKDFKSDQVICYIDYFEENQRSLCHIYSYPYILKCYNIITNNFPGGLFKYVREVELYDERPFEHEFFLQIAQSFPFIKELSIKNSKPQNKKFCKESENNKYDFMIIKYSHLTNLTLYYANDDYIEEFLIDTNICLPNNSLHLNINYEQLKRVTHNFTRDLTRINCAKLNSLCLNGDQLPMYAKDYFPQL
ncbi:unnamed protein product [Rotaria sordida]|uniref:Uncharacterized protein n=1 Tax=Rotaria sordida TaxID=392033 RepID=A0A815AXJ6_9BILA|nr:unnamed protein product [Rotaria sordida]CAF3869170.1 unnamed protein product [Rotaria sordida]